MHCTISIVEEVRTLTFIRLTFLSSPALIINCIICSQLFCIPVIQSFFEMQRSQNIYILYKSLRPHSWGNAISFEET